MLSFEFSEFYRDWMAKASEYDGTSTRTYFDKFFTLFVVYNRLYAEATFELARRGEINLSNRNAFPDRPASTVYLLQFLGSTNLLRQLESDSECKFAMDRIVRLIEENRFHIKLHLITGNPQPEEDLDLLRKLRSANKNTRAHAILDLIYSIRCNMFHGHKGFEEVQRDLLEPTIVILEKVIGMLYKGLKKVPNRA